MASIVCAPSALIDSAAWVRALSGECDMLSLQEGQKVSRSAIEGEATKRAPTRGAPTVGCLVARKCQGAPDNTEMSFARTVFIGQNRGD